MRLCCMWSRLPCPGVVTLCPGAWDSANLELSAGLDSVPLGHSEVPMVQLSVWSVDPPLLGARCGARTHCRQHFRIVLPAEAGKEPIMAINCNISLPWCFDSSHDARTESVSPYVKQIRGCFYWVKCSLSAALLSTLWRWKPESKVRLDNQIYFGRWSKQRYFWEIL